MKKIILTLSIIAFGISSSMAMSESKPAGKQQNNNAAKTQGSHHKLVNIYAKDDKNSQISGKITLKNQNSYNIFYCKQNNWCEVVSEKDGKTGWISLDQLKQSQQKYAKVMHKKNTIKRLAEYTKLQDQKIVQLQTMMMQMQGDFAKALKQQQMQINQLKQAYYYQ